MLRLMKKERIRRESKHLPAAGVPASAEDLVAGATLIDAVREISHHDVELEPARYPMPVRPVEFAEKNDVGSK